MIRNFDEFRCNYRDLVNESVRFSGLTAEFFIRAKARHLIEQMRRSLGDSSDVRALDIGRGLGSMHPHVAPAFESVTGIDVAIETIEPARRNNPWVDYQVSNGDRLPFADSSFEVVFSVCVMHHVQPSDWSAFVAEMAPVTANGGLVIVFEHNPYNPLTRFVVRRSRLDVGAILVAASTVKGFFRRSGLRNIQSRHIPYTPFEGRSALALERALGWLPAGAQYFVAGRKP